LIGQPIELGVSRSGNTLHHARMEPIMESGRVVITGLGVIAPNGIGIDEFCT